MFVRINDFNPGPMVTIVFDGRKLQVRAGLSVAAALLEANIDHFRTTPVTSSKRAVYCMMGVCFDCLMIIDGVANQQACMTKVQNGMHIQRQTGAADIFEQAELPGTDT